jgi:hypothetical protein
LKILAGRINKVGSENTPNHVGVQENIVPSEMKIKD